MRPRRGRMRYPVFRSKLVGSASSGAEMEPHPLQFSTNPGPSGPAGIRTLTQILRAGNFLPSPRGNPRNRGPGADSPCQGEMSRSDRGGRSVHPEPSPGDPQGELPRRGKRGWPGPLVSFPSPGKKLAARRRRNPPLRAAQCILSGSAEKQGFQQSSFGSFSFKKRNLILQALHGRGNPPAPVHEGLGREGVDRLHRGGAQPACRGRG